MNDSRDVTPIKVPHFCGYTDAELQLAREIATAVNEVYGTDEPDDLARIRVDGIWNDHPAVQSALAALRMAKRRDGLTGSQSAALKWLRRRNCDGLFDKNGIVVAAGETAPFMRGTWNALRNLGLVEFYNPTGKKRGRLRLTALARALA